MTKQIVVATMGMIVLSIVDFAIIKLTFVPLSLSIIIELQALSYCMYCSYCCDLIYRLSIELGTNST